MALLSFANSSKILREIRQKAERGEYSSQAAYDTQQTQQELRTLSSQMSINETSLNEKFVWRDIAEI
jgi:hypothetical protein